jgi:hypothetical protein
MKLSLALLLVCISCASTQSQRPSWVDGADARFPASKYLCAVGSGGSRDAAEKAGFAALARIFEAKITSVSEDFLAEYSKTGAPPLNVQSSEVRNAVQSQQTLSDVQIPEVWTDKTTVFALACLERSLAARAWRDKINPLDDSIGKKLVAAEQADKRAKVKNLSEVLLLLTERQVLNSQLSLLENGPGIKSQYSQSDVAQAFGQATEALQLGVQVTGPYADDFRSALIEGLTQKHYKIGDTDLDVLISASIRMESSKITDRDLYFARPVVVVEVRDVKASKVLGTLNESQKEGHRSQIEAERRAVRKLAEKILDEVGNKIEAQMLR